MILTVSQKVALTVEFKDSKGNVAPVDGVPVWASSDETVATVSASTDGMSATALATGKVGLAQISVTADADLDPGEQRELAATLDLDIRPNEAVTAGISAGTPEEQ